jgi:hypothetical protein
MNAILSLSLCKGVLYRNLRKRAIFVVTNYASVEQIAEPTPSI